MLNKTFRDFLAGTLMKELKCLYEEGKNDCPPNPLKYRYHLFILIAIGIETLGAALDNEEWHKNGSSKERFNKALENYKSLQKYQNENLYENLRCGMAHTYVPKKYLDIRMASEGNIHNVKDNNILYLHIEKTFKDYLEACQELLDNIDGKIDSLNGKLGDKVFRDFINVPG